MEVMIALALASFGLLTMIGVYISGVHLMARGEEITASTDIGRQFLDTVKTGGFATLPPGAVVFDGRANDPQTADGFPPAPYPGVGPRMLVVRCEELDSRLKSVTVSVYYDAESKVDLQTYLRP